MHDNINDDYGFVDNYDAPFSAYLNNEGCCGDFDSNSNQMYFSDEECTDSNGDLIEQFNPVYNQAVQALPSAYLAANTQTRLLNNRLYNSGLSNNGLYNNGLLSNGLYSPGLYNSGLYNSGLYSPGLYNSGLLNNGLYSPGLYNSGLYSPGLYNSGLYSPGLYNNGLYTGLYNGPYNNGLYNNNATYTNGLSGLKWTAT